MLRFKLNVDDKKILVGRLGELVGEQPRYTYMPRCAYECGVYTIERSGDLVVEEGDADEALLQTLLDEGLIVREDEAAMQTDTDSDSHGETEAEDTASTEETEGQAEEDFVSDEEYEQEIAEEAAANLDSVDEEAPDSMTISFPLDKHTGESLRRLLNLLYSRGPLLSKSTGGRFRVDKELITAMDDAGTPVSAGDFRTILAEYTAGHGGLEGLEIEEDKVSLTGFPYTEDPEMLLAFQQLASQMNRMALTQKRIQAKVVNDDNEKYALRIWLIRLGMNGGDFKTARKVLMKNLSGHTAFRTREEAERFSEKQKQKRDELRALKAAAADEGGDEESGT